MNNQYYAVEYEIFPMRAIYTESYDASLWESEDVFRAAYALEYPNRKIRKVTRIGEAARAEDK